MIIECNNCKKKFEVDSLLIPEKGRLVLCISCNHKWFFKNSEIQKPAKVVKNENLELLEISNIEKTTFFNNNNKSPIENISNSSTTHEKNKNKQSNLLGLIIVFIISFIALIIVLDTFQTLIVNIIPNIEFLLYNLYETFNDVGLFLKDLI